MSLPQSPQSESWRSLIQSHIDRFPYVSVRSYCPNHWDNVKPYVIGAGSAMAVTSLLYPITTIKTVMQAASRNEFRRGNIAFIYNFFRTNGLHVALCGVPVAFLGQGVATCSKLYVLRHATSSFVPVSDPEALAITFLGCLAFTLAYTPFDLISTRAQVDTLLPLSLKRRYTTFTDAFLSTMKQTGKMSLWRGISYNITRNICHLGSTIWLYNSIRNEFKIDHPIIKALGTASAYTLSTIITYPLDTCKTLIQSSLLYKPTLYNTIIPTIRTHGIRTLYKGVCSSCIVSIASSALLYTSVELVGKSTFLR